MSRFTPPWKVCSSPDAFWIEDAAGHQFAYCYIRKRPDQPDAPHLLSYDEARRIVTNIAKLPDLIGRKE